MELRFLSATRHNTGHFGYVLPSTSLGLILKKLNPTQQNHTTQGQNGKKHPNSKPKSKENLNQQSSIRTVYVCAYHCAQLLYTIHSTEQF